MSSGRTVRGNYSRSQLMKRNSRLLVTYCVSKLRKASRKQIAEITGLSRAHVGEVVDELIGNGELIEVESVSVGRGRPTTLLQISPESVSAAGVWLAEDYIEVGIAGGDGEIRARENLSYSGDPLRDIDTVAKAIQTCAGRVGKPIAALRGVGIVVSGLVNPNLGVIRHTTRDNGFGGVPIAKLFEERMGIPAHADTDIRAAALVDQWQRTRHERALYISVSNGVSAAFVNEMELFGNVHGEAPGVGHITVERNGLPCECGKRGCLQAYTSDRAFVRRLWPEMDLRKLSSLELEEMARRGVDMAAQGDYDAIAAISSITEYIGLGVSIAVNMLDPQTVYVAGTLIDCAPDMVMSLIRREAMPRITHVFQGVEIKPLMQLQRFEFRGAFGLVLLNQFRALNQDINTKLMFPYASNNAAPAIGS